MLFRSEATLKRLPAGITIVEPLPRISADDKQAVFEIEATKDVLVGQYKDIYCDVTVVEAGQTIHQQAGAGIVRVDPERVKTATR